MSTEVFEDEMNMHVICVFVLSFLYSIKGLKYAKAKGIIVHKAASYVIARRGMGYAERLPRRIYGEINKSLLTRWRNYYQFISNI